MKVASTIARYLLGIIFLVFGLNGFFHFIHMPPPAGLAGQFMGAVIASHFYVVVFLIQAISGILLLSGRYVPLSLVLIGPEVVVIVCFHAFMAPSGLPFAIVVAILWLLVFARVHRAFAAVFTARA